MHTRFAISLLACLGFASLAAARQPTTPPAMPSDAVGADFASTPEPAPANAAPIIADRPGLPFSTTAVTPGRLQLEIGTPTITLDDSGGVETTLVNFPASLRYGLTDRVELRLDGPIYNFLDIEDDAGDRSFENGFADLGVGTKIEISQASEAIPASALLASIGLPIGEEPFGSDDPTFDLSYAASYGVTDRNELVFLGGASAADEGDGYEVTGTLAVLVSQSLSDRAGVYVEAGWFPPFFHTGVEDAVVAGAGVTYLLTDRVQLDAFFDRGLTEGAPDWNFGAGISLVLRP